MHEQFLELSGGQGRIEIRMEVQVARFEEQLQEELPKRVAG
jgi:hypothetical protein